MEPSIKKYCQKEKTVFTGFLVKICLREILHFPKILQGLKQARPAHLTWKLEAEDWLQTLTAHKNRVQGLQTCPYSGSSLLGMQGLLKPPLRTWLNSKSGVMICITWLNLDFATNLCVAKHSINNNFLQMVFSIHAELHRTDITSLKLTCSLMQHT